MGIVYLLHLNTPLAHAKHYTGWSTNKKTLAQRLAHHERGTANCNFTDALHEKGIGFTLAATIPGVDRNFERRLKETHNVTRYCPICNPKAQKKYKPKCLHPNKIGDNYGESCQDCKKPLAGYGYGGWFGSELKPVRKCKHRFVEVDGRKTCMYCEREK